MSFDIERMMKVANNKIETIKFKLNNCSFTGVEEVLVGDALHYPLLGMDEKFYSANFFQKMIRCIKWSLIILGVSFIDKYDYEHIDGSNTLFLFSSSYGEREDMKACFYKVVDTIDRYSMAVYNGQKRVVYTGIRDLYLFLKWKKELRAHSIAGSLYERMYILLNMVKPYHDYNCICNHFESEGIDFDNIVTWCDVHCVDSMFVQKFKNREKKTITLQHGFYSEINNNWTIKGIKSDYFFAENEFTADILKRNNYTGEIIVCGSVHNIGVHNKKITSDDKFKKIGVILSGELLHDFNEEIIKKISLIEGIDKYDLYCKFHPTSILSTYSIEGDTKYKAVFGKDISGSKFLQDIDLAILCPSTMIYESLYQDVPFIVVEDPYEMYRDYCLPEEFLVKIEELDIFKIESIYGDIYKEKFMKIKDYYVTCGNIDKYYKNAFNTIGVG